MSLGKENVGVEEMHWIARRLVCDPRDDPFIQHRVAVVMTAQVRRVARKRPSLYDREAEKEPESCPTRVTGESLTTRPRDPPERHQRDRQRGQRAKIQNVTSDDAPERSLVRARRP